MNDDTNPIASFGQIDEGLDATGRTCGRRYRFYSI